MASAKKLFDKDFSEMLGGELIALTGGIIAGTILAASKDQILLVPGMLILLPGFLEMRGSISGSMSARLSSALFLKVTKPRIKGNRVLRENIMASVILAFAVSLILGIAAYAFSYYFFGITSTKIIFVAVFAGILSNIIQIPITVLLNFWVFSHGHDPNNVMGPYMTTIGDIVSIASILLVVAMI